jgi:hypothetical protein
MAGRYTVRYNMPAIFVYVNIYICRSRVSVLLACVQSRTMSENSDYENKNNFEKYTDKF